MTVSELLKAAQDFTDKRIVIFFESNMLDQVYTGSKFIKCYDARPILVSLKHMLCSRDESGVSFRKSPSNHQIMAGQKSKADFKIQRMIRVNQI